MSDTVTRLVLSSAVGKETDLSIVESSKIVDAIFSEMTQGLKEDGVVKIPFFGSFYVRKKAGRIGRNPKTKIEAVITARNVVSFYSSNKLKEKLNK